MCVVREPEKKNNKWQKKSLKEEKGRRVGKRYCNKEEYPVDKMLRLVHIWDLISEGNSREVPSCLTEPLLMECELPALEDDLVTQHYGSSR